MTPCAGTHAIELRPEVPWDARSFPERKIVVAVNYGGSRGTQGVATSYFDSGTRLRFGGELAEVS